MRIRSRFLLRLALGVSTLALGLLLSPSAHAQRRGSTPSYGVELEPHLVWQWAEEPWYSNDDGIGIGGRASIPLIDHGPIQTINNNLAITFGLDWAHFDNDCSPADCSADDIWVPVAAQWNFFVTPSISLFPELGLGIHHWSVNWDNANGVCYNPPGPVRNVCDGDDDTDIDLVLWMGARFAVADNIDLTLRIGTPSLNFGVSFFL